MKYFTIKQDKRGIATLLFDTPDSDANVFSSASMSELDVCLEGLKNDKTIKILFIQSAKEHIFIAGADIHEIKKANNKKEIDEFIKKGQDVFNKLQNLPFVVVSVIDGACLGGGLEMSLACTYRIATSNEHTRLGFPEVNLGIIPGFGGTQRLYRLVGYAKAMELTLGAKQLKGEKALKLGLVDACVPSGYLKFKKEEFVQEILDGNLDKKVQKNRKGIVWYEHIALYRTLVNSIAKKNVLKKTQGHYPAPLELINIMQKTFLKPLQEGLDIERASEVVLASTTISKNLIELFLISEELKNDSFSKSTPKKIRETALVGVGIMGSGIAWAMNYKNLNVRLKVRSFESAAKTIQKIRKLYDRVLKRGRLTEREIDLKMDKITYTNKYQGFSNIDFLLEAVSEDTSLKIKVYSEFEEILNKDAIIATNTSSISISQLAHSLKNPQRFIGMHFFNPVNSMPLVEIIAGEKTSEETIATVVTLAKKLGKTPIKIKDCAGFLVNRILLPYLKEAVLMFEEGEDIENIDKILLEFGMPMGPFTLVDTVGVDTGASVATILYNAYGERMASSQLMQNMVEKKWFGKKTKIGFYDYTHAKSTHNKDISIFQTGKNHLKTDTILSRSLMIMINEATRCLEEGVIDNARYLDMAMVMGTGFPAFRGGLMRYADTLGAKIILRTLENLASQYGERFAPSELIKEMAQKNDTFYGGAL